MRKLESSRLLTNETYFNLEQLIKNINTVEFYLTEGNEDEQAEASDLVRRGSCLIAYQIGNEIRFAPSRFLGYVNNSLKGHIRSQVDGRETNVVINKILNSHPLPDENLQELYLGYCEGLGLKADNKKHKFWKFELQVDFEKNNALTGEFPEGKIVERKHKARERNSVVVAIAKEDFKEKYGKLFCQICEFDFEDKYGKLGKDFIEGHHTIAVSDMQQDHKTKPEDIAMVCSNCHKMVHKKRPWLTMTELKKVLKRK